MKQIARRFWASRLIHVGPIVERGQLPRGTSTAEMVEHVATPLYYRLLIAAESLTEATAERATAATLAAAWAGVFTSARRQRRESRFIRASITGRTEERRSCVCLQPAFLTKPSGDFRPSMMHV